MAIEMHIPIYFAECLEVILHVNVLLQIAVCCED